MADSYRSLMGTSSESTIASWLRNSWNAQSEVATNMRIRRMLISRDRSPATSNLTGTVLPSPFDETTLAIRTMIGEASDATQDVTSRLTANKPEISVIPITAKKDISSVVDKMAGTQQRFDDQLIYEMGAQDNLWRAAWAKSVGGAAFHLILPRDTDFGLPDRMYYDESDEEIDALKSADKLAPMKHTLPSGQMVYAEHGDVWAARRKAYMNEHAVGSVPGRSLFRWSVYPRDMVLYERDNEAKDLRCAAIFEEIAAADCEPGSDFARDIAKRKGVPADDQGLWGVYYDAKQKRIIGGIPAGGPLNTSKSAYSAYTLIHWFDREDLVILAAPRGSVQGATELWRGPHGCKVMGVPSCPVVEDAFYRTDVNVAGKDFATSLDRVFAYVPGINQLLTIGSNIATVNGIPRYVMDTSGAGTIRGVDGEPVSVESVPVPGLNPNEMAAYPGKVTQLVINDESLLEWTKIYFERLALAMPQKGGEASGADAAAWAIQERNQEAAAPFVKPVENGCQALTGINQRCHGWLRDLDIPVYFWAAPGHRQNQRDIRGLTEMDPKDLTDSIKVTQKVSTQAEQTVEVQVAMQQWQAGLIDDEEYYRQVGEQDAREAVVRRWVQVITNYVMTGALPPTPEGAQPGPDPIVKVVADGVRGAVQYALIQQSDNYAFATARSMAAAASQQAMMMNQPPPPGAPAGGAPSGPGGQPSTTPQGAAPVGLPPTAPAVPGLGMANTLQQQLGPSAPGFGGAPAAPAGVA